MNKEDMEKLAVAATNNYFATLSPDARLLVTSDKAGYMHDYYSTYEIAFSELLKFEANKSKAFGSEEAASKFK